MWAVVLLLSCPPPVPVLVTDGDIRSFIAVTRFSAFVAGVLGLRPVFSLHRQLCRHNFARAAAIYPWCRSSASDA